MRLDFEAMNGGKDDPQNRPDPEGAETGTKAGDSGHPHSNSMAHLTGRTERCADQDLEDGRENWDLLRNVRSRFFGSFLLESNGCTYRRALETSGPPIVRRFDDGAPLQVPLKPGKQSRG